MKSMPVMKAIKAATIINAKILEMDTQIGALEPGYLILLQQMKTD
jgi:imidazolonepropionase-like amidohydrolase